MSTQSATTTIAYEVTVAEGVFAPGHLGELTQYLPFELVDDVLAETRTVQRRLRDLPSRAGVYFVLALGLFPHLGYARVWGKLTAGLVGLGLAAPSEKALRDLRRRLGPAPLKALFEIVAGPLAQPHTPGVRFGGLRTVAFDGLNSLKVPDTSRNRSWIGRIRYRMGFAGYPTLRLMALAETGTRGLLGATIGCAADRDEANLARRLLYLLGPGMLLLLDRGFDGNAFLTEVHATGAMLLARAKSTRNPRVRQPLPDGSYLSDLDGLDVRIIEADVAMTGADGSRTGDRYRLITTLTDHRRYPALALVRLYHERWEIETAYLALRHTLLGAHVLRSGDRPGLEQETWALLTLYQLLRTAMTDAIETQPGANPDRASFTTALEAARDTPKQIIHIALDSARPGVFGISPMQAALLPVTAWLFAAADGKEGFRKGLPPSFHADFPNAAKETDMRRWRDQYRVDNLGARNIGTPIITKGGVTLKELQQGRMQDVLSFKTQCRDEIFAIFGVPPSKATVIESGNLGGGTGDAQDKTYRIDTCQPIAQIVLEKLNFHLTLQAFGITDWHLKFGQIDYRDSQIIENIRDMRLRNGSWTRNRYAADIGEPPVDGGDDAVLVDRQNLVLWSDMVAMSKATVAAKLGATQLAAAGGTPQQALSDPDDTQPSHRGPASGADDEPADESLRRVQYATYRRRLSSALRTLPVAEAAHPAVQDTTDAVYDQLAENWPPKAIAWTRDAEWEGPMNVGIHQIDTSDRDQWTASHEPDRVAKIQKKIRKRAAAGKHPKPLVLVRRPGSDEDLIADGHHHFLAQENEGQHAVWAYVGRVSADRGPWDAMRHSRQLVNGKLPPKPDDQMDGLAR